MSFRGRTSSESRVPQGERFEHVFQCLQHGLREYMQSSKTELENVGAQLGGAKRCSRLGVLYDLDKQMKSLERFSRRLEFHNSKVEELRESHIRLRRLRDGAVNMMRAYEMSRASSREARHSLSELQKSLNEYTQAIFAIEKEMEAYMGQFYITMKGLAGYSRLCSGDHYEVTVQYGRQRWQPRGRIDNDGQQSWESSETTLQPLVSDLMQIKVMEQKGLMSQVSVGEVTCDPAQLLCVLPQTLALDVNTLGTIRLAFHITWMPFIQDDSPSAFRHSSSTTGLTGRSLSSPCSPPDTPSTADLAFFDGSENGDDSSSVFSDSLDSPLPNPAHGGSLYSPLSPVSPLGRDCRMAKPPMVIRPAPSDGGNGDWSLPGRRSLSTSDVGVSAVSNLVLPTSSTGLSRPRTGGPPSDGSRSVAPGGDKDICLDEAIAQLLQTITAMGKRSREMVELETEIKALEDVLQGTGLTSRASSVSLTVESALGSFDFLNADDDDGDEDLNVALDTGRCRTNAGPSSIALTEDTGVGPSSRGSPVPMTSGSESLDQALVDQLVVCCHLLQDDSNDNGHVLHRLSEHTKALGQMRELCCGGPSGGDTSMLLGRLGLNDH
uniref:rho family-interacting cell polarization regulator 2-like n=1 Tax=Myxine glutinosa TaxID=7769 RepID=UPI00358F2364